MKLTSWLSAARMLADDAPDRPIRQQAVAAFTLARSLGWEGADNLTAARRLLFVRWLLQHGQLVEVRR